MKKVLFVLTILACFSASCGVFGSLTSHTIIGANESFVLGEGQHGSYSVRLRNTSRQTLTITQTQSDGTVIKTVSAPHNVWLSLDIAKNTAVRISNTSDRQAAVDLKVQGDTNLSMGYQK
jgi:hypothetical protein